MTNIDYVGLFMYCYSTYIFDKQIRVDDMWFPMFQFMLENSDFEEDTISALDLLIGDGVSSMVFYEGYQILKTKYRAKEISEQEDEYTIPRYSLVFTQEQEQQFLKAFSIGQIENMKKLAFHFYTCLEMAVSEEIGRPAILGPMDAKRYCKALCLKYYS